MVSEIRICAEGGGDRSDSKAAVREGFSQFLGPLRELARTQGLRWYITACGSRRSTFEKFQVALELHVEAFNILLVDSEARVEGAAWEHLRGRDGWPVSAADGEHCHLMAQVMEAWLVADPETLAEFYGQGFHRGALPRRLDVEEVPKEDLYEALNRATAKSRGKGKYHKIHHGPELLKRLDSRQVCLRARHCDRLFTALETLIRS